MPKITIDGKEVEVEAGMTVLQACEQIGIEIPRFCYHDRLSIAGNCRMCLVEMEKSPKPIASCAMPVSDNMVIHTDTPGVKKAREGVMEFLLINHPLDCPICDQGGECDLQDQAMAYGRGKNRFHENKRAVQDKYMGPLIKTHMTRCIHCTRCIRFATEVAGVEELGAIGRGEHMEVTTYVEKAVTSELSGNMIDLCPVGALTSKPYAFKARSWELKKTESIDVLDAVGANIRVDSRGMEVMRVLPRLNEDVNEEWISDKSRFSYDGLLIQRLDRPYVRVNGKLQEKSWDDALKVIAEKLSSVEGDKIGAIAGDLADAESIVALKDLMDSLGSSVYECRQDDAKINTNGRSSYLFNTTIAGIEQADFCLLIGCNPRYEASLVNARLRKRYLKGGFTIASIGPKLDLTYPVIDLGNDASVLEKILDGSSEISEKLTKAKNPMLIIGSMALVRDDAELIQSIASEIAEKHNFVTEEWNGYNLLHKAASRVAGLDLGFVTDKNVYDAELLFLLGADEIGPSKIYRDTFVIYIGHHGDEGAHRADVILPATAYTEKNATYVNLEGRVQRTNKAVSAPGQALEDWKIIKLISDATHKPLPYNNLSEVRARLAKEVPHFAMINKVNHAKWVGIKAKKGKLLNEPFRETVSNFYMTNPISRVSKIMAECSSIISKKEVA
jgi:NADH-quinone oxidoreductase subunit G